MVCAADYERELIEWSGKFNLTAIRSEEGIRIKHFLDSFSCVLAWKGDPPATLIDVGTGAGFPGLVLKILYPSMRLTLVESVGKKTDFCRHMVELLKMDKRGDDHRPGGGSGTDAHAPGKVRLGGGAGSGEPAGAGGIPVTAGETGRCGLAQKGSTGPLEADKAEEAIRMLGGR